MSERSPVNCLTRFRDIFAVQLWVKSIEILKNKIKVNNTETALLHHTDHSPKYNSKFFSSTSVALPCLSSKLFTYSVCEMQYICR